jgi:hypothetical protein
MSGMNKTCRISALAIIKTGLCCLLGALVLNAGTHIDFRHPFIGYGFGGVFLLQIAAERSPRRLAILGAMGALLTAWVVWGRYDGVATLLVQVLGAFGLASLLLLTYVVFWNGRDREPTAYRMLVPAIMLVVLVLGAQSSLNIAAFFNKETLDPYAFAFDGSLGFQPSFVLARFVNSKPWLLPLAKVSYEGIPLALAALYAGFMCRRNKPVWEIIEVLFISTMIGYVFFCIFPVCGPRYAFGQEFPDTSITPDAFRQLTPSRTPLPVAFPRNGVPSLHLTWALLIWLNTRSLPRWAWWAALALVLATMFDTLASGEHYLFDLAVALPFTLWMQAGMACTASVRNRRRWLPAVCGCALFLAWLVLGRFGFPLMVISPAMPWFLVIASSTLSIAWALRLPQLISEMQANHASQLSE